MAFDIASPPVDLVSPDRFDSLRPGSSDVLASYPAMGPDEVGAAVARARAASEWWASQGWDGRRRHVRAFKALIARELSELADLVHLENGKPRADAILEIVSSLEHLEWVARHAERILRCKRVSPGLSAGNHAATVEYQPLGVIGVIGPWNYPVHTPLASIASALAAGNAVLFKPSEFTTGVGVWLGEAWGRAVPSGADVFTVVTGLGETGAALCRSGVDKVSFTGSSATGRKVMAACAEGLVPVLMECGGKDAMIVDDDADVVAAADAALWGAMSNAGQTCVGIERIYATDRVYARLVDELALGAQKLRGGSDATADYGPITMPAQVAVIERHLGDALARGGRAVVGGGIDGVVVQPTILVDVPEDAAAVREETFGPTVTVTKVRDVDEAIELSNATAFGLGGSVFTGSPKRGIEIARRLRTGMTSVNAVQAFSAMPALPFGGIGESGFGRVHGEDGLREFARAKAITAQRFALPIPLLSFRRPRRLAERLVWVARLVHGRG